MEDNASSFSLIHDFTKMIPAGLEFKNGVHGAHKNIRKCMLISRQATVSQIMNEFAHIPKLMSGALIESSHNTIIFCLKDNRKSEGRR